MAPFQFAHIETYPLKRSSLSTGRGTMQTASSILAEAARLDGHIVHIDKPLPPIMLAGQENKDPTLQLQEYLARNKKVIINKHGQRIERAVAETTHVLMTAIYSYPIPVSFVDETLADKFFKDCLGFHKVEFGEVHIAYKHRDESYLHIHCYTFSNNAKSLHPGFRAKKVTNNGAYNRAMKKFQDRFYEQVSKHHGLERIGPKLERLKSKHYTYVKRSNKAALELWYEDEKAKTKKKLDEYKLEQKAITQSEIEQIIESLSKTENQYIDFKANYEELSAYGRKELEWLESQINELQTTLGSYKEMLAELIEHRNEVQNLREENHNLKKALKELGEESSFRFNG